MASERVLVAQAVAESEPCLEKANFVNMQTPSAQRQAELSSGNARTCTARWPLLVLGSCLVLAILGAAKLGNAPSEAGSSGSTVQLDSEGSEADECKSCGDLDLDLTKKSRPLCTSIDEGKSRRLNEQADETAKLENWEHAEEKGKSKKAGSVEDHLKAWVKSGEADNKHTGAEEDSAVAATTETTTRDCIEVESVLAMTMPVKIKHSAEIPIVLLQPMFERSFRQSVCASLQIQFDACEKVAVRLASNGARRLQIQKVGDEDTISEDVIDSHSFMLMAEVTAPSEDALHLTMSKDFLDKFTKEVEASVNQEGSEQGMGQLHRLATYGKVEMVESSTDSLEGKYTSLGYGNVCRKNRKDDSIAADGTKVVQPVGSIRTCSTICNTHGPGCHGFEYRYSEQRCELWLVEICSGEESPWSRAVDFECFRKCE